MKDFRVDLKVCEGCGALWLRAADQGNYCRGCAVWLSEFPAPRSAVRRGRGRKLQNTRMAGMQRGCAMKNVMEMARSNVLVMQSKVRRLASMEGVREATTGRVVIMTPGVMAPAAILPRVWAVAEAEPKPEQPAAELAFYRKYTEGMLRRYVTMCMEAGRVPSLLGRELFRGQVSSCRVHSFEDVVIFCLDMETLLHGLPDADKQVIKRIGMQRYSQGEAAAMLGLSLRDCIRRYTKALDRLTEKLLEARMLNPAAGLPKILSRGCEPLIWRKRFIAIEIKVRKSWHSLSARFAILVKQSRAGDSLYGVSRFCVWVHRARKLNRSCRR